MGFVFCFAPPFFNEWSIFYLFFTFFSLKNWSITYHVVTTLFLSSVQFSPLSCVQFFVTPWTAARQASLSITNSWSLLKLKSESVMSSNHLILFCPLLPLSSIFPNIRDFSTGLVLHIKWPNYWEFIFRISPFSEYSGLITFTIDYFDLLAVQATFKSPLQHHNSKASIICAQPSLWSNSHIHTWLVEKP